MIVMFDWETTDIALDILCYSDLPLRPTSYIHHHNMSLLYRRVKGVRGEEENIMSRGRLTVKTIKISHVMGFTFTKKKRMRNYLPSKDCNSISLSMTIHSMRFLKMTKSPSTDYKWVLEITVHSIVRSWWLTTSTNPKLKSLICNVFFHVVGFGSSPEICKPWLQRK